jgi:hypothetical protein
MLELLLAVTVNASSPKPTNPEPLHRGGSRTSMIVSEVSAKSDCPKPHRGSGRRCEGNSAI